MNRKPSRREPMEGSSLEHQDTREIILDLKAKKKTKGWSIERIEEEILRRGKSVSRSTLKRIFRPGSEDHPASFSLDHSLLPVDEVLSDDDDASDPSAPVQPDVSRLKLELQIQVERVESLLAQNDILLDRVNFMQTQIERKDRRMDERDAMLDKVIAERDELRTRLDALKGANDDES